MDFDPLCLGVWVVQKGTVQIYMKPVTGISTTLMKEVIILHCRVVYQSNVLPGRWAWLGMQSFSDYEFCGVGLINKWIPFCCASVQQDVTDAARTKEKHKKRNSFKPFTLGEP